MNKTTGKAVKKDARNKRRQSAISMVTRVVADKRQKRERRLTTHEWLRGGI